MDIFLPLYETLLFALLISVMVRIMTRKALVISSFHIYLFFAIAFLIPLLVSGIFIIISGYEIRKSVNAPVNFTWIVFPLLCLIVFTAVFGVIMLFLLRRSYGDIVLINVEEQKAYDAIKQVLESHRINYTENRTDFSLGGGNGSIHVLTRMNSNTIILQLIRSRHIFSILFAELREAFGNYYSSKTPWGSFWLLLPFLPLLIIAGNNTPILKDLLDIDLRSLGSWPRIVGGYGARGTYLSGQIIALCLLILAVRGWIRKPLVITPMYLRLGGVVLVIQMFSLSLTSLTNFHLHLGLILISLLGIAVIFYYTRIAGKYYGFMNTSTDEVYNAVTEALNQQNILFSENRHGFVLQDETEFKLHRSNQSTVMEVSQPGKYKELLKASFEILGRKPSSFSVAENLLFLFFALMAIAYWFSPYLFRLIFR